MPYYPYSRVVPDSSIPFTSIGLRHLEQTALLDAFGKPGLPLDPDQEEWLKHMTGCQTFLEFRERIFSPHHLVSHDHSLLLIEEVLRRGGRRPVETLMFRALLMSTAGECIALVRRRLNRHDGVVDHNMLEVRPEFGGKGVGSVVAQSHEDAWHAAGFRQVALTAGELDRGTMEFGTVKFDHGHTRRDGRVFWAKQGFDFHRTKGLSNAARIRQGIVAELSRAAVAGLIGAEFAAELSKNIDLVPAHDLVFVKDEHGGELGVKAFRQHDWEAFKG